MSTSRWVERGLLIVVLLSCAWLAVEQRRAPAALLEMQSRLDSLEVKIDAVLELQKSRLLQASGGSAERPPPITYTPSPGPQGGAAGGGSYDDGYADDPYAGGAADPMGAAPAPAASRRGQLAQRAKGAARMIVGELYQTADEMAEAENWDDATYNQVSGIFDQTTTEIGEIFQSVRAGELSMQEARGQAEALRDDTTDRMEDVLGEEGFERLRQRLATKGQQLRQQVRRRR